jgi:hypothetical protein
MYLSTTSEEIYVVLSQPATSNELRFVASYNDIDANGMILPQSSVQGFTDGISAQYVLQSPAASTTRQLIHFTIYNEDIDDAVVTLYKTDGFNNFTLCTFTIPAGNGLQWTREIGWQLFGNSTTNQTKIITIVSSGSYVKPAGLKRALICCVGAGGGGGSGRQGASGENRGGGGGGGGGAVVWLNIGESELPSSVVVTIGTGGTGGASQITSSNNGNAGTNGGDTSFGSFVIAKGGTGGGAGSLTAGAAGAGGVVSTGNPTFGAYALVGAAGGAGVITTSTPSAGGTGFAGNSSCAGGGGAGGITSANASTAIGGAGGAVYENGVLYSGAPSGATPNGTDNRSKLLFFNTTLNNGYGLGTGGAGGYNLAGFTNGGNGGNYGAGGGGGSATLNGTQSGKGGNGGGGMITILEIY